MIKYLKSSEIKVPIMLKRDVWVKKTPTIDPKINDEIINTLNIHINFDDEYKKTSDIINKIEDFYDNEQKLLSHYKKSLNQEGIITDDVDNHIHNMEHKLKKIYKDYMLICNNLDNIIRKFPDTENTAEYNEKYNTF